MVRGLATGCCLIVAMLGYPPSSAADIEDASQWGQIRTDHFRFISNASSSTTIKIGTRLEQLAQALAGTTGGSVESVAPTLIVIFKDEASFNPFKMLANGRPDSVVGYYQSTPYANYIAIDASAGNTPFQTIYHEFVHYFVNYNIPYIPLWLNEGLAEYYSTFRVDGKRVKLGYPIESHRLWLATYQLLPLNQVFAIGQQSSSYQEGMRRGVFYAESWALAHYLMTDPVLRGQFPKLLGELRKGAEANDAFQAAYGLNLTKLEEQLEAQYTRDPGLRFVEFQFDRDLEAATPAVVPLKRGEAYSCLGDLLLNHHPVQTSAVEEYLQAALAADSTRALTYASLGGLRHEQNRPAEARQAYERAVELAPEDPWIRLRFGRSLLEEYFVPGKPYRLSARTTPPVLLEAREQLRRCIELDSLSVEDELAFGRTFLLDREGAFEGIAAMTFVVNQEPWRLDAVSYLVIMTANTGNTPAACSLLEKSLRPNGSREDVYYAEMAIVEAAIRQADALLDQERIDDARTLLQQTATKVQEPSARGRVETSLAELDLSLEQEAQKKR